MPRHRLFYGWIVVGASAIIICIGFGGLFSLAVFLKPIEDSEGWSRTSISAVALINWIALGIGSLLWGVLSDRFGTRVVVIAGGFLVGLGMVLSSQVQALWQLYATFGFMVGLAGGAFYAPLTSTATKWFTANRGLAVALVSAGIGLGTLAMAPFSYWLITLYGWRAAMLVMGDISWLIIIPLALLIRDAPSDLGMGPMGSERQATGREFSPREVARSGQFWVIALTHFACCAAHSGPIFHMVAHAADQGVGKMVAASVFGVSGLSSVGGRISSGVLADRFGAKGILLVGLALQAVTVFLYIFARDVGSFYALAVGFGIAYGGVMPLYALVTRDYFGEKVMGTAYGSVFLVSTLGMGLGSFAGGWFYDYLGSYAWLYLSSASIGVMAAVLSLSFRPRPHVICKARHQRAADSV